jgi:hypothetical protein
MKTLIPVIAAISFTWLFNINANAQTCNFEKSGNALSGNAYQASIRFPSITTKSAIDGMSSKLESSGQKILGTDIAQGTLKAEQPSKNSGRALPISASVRQTKDGTEIVVTIRLNPLQLAPDDAVKTELCAYANAATQGNVNAGTQTDVAKNVEASISATVAETAKNDQASAKSEFVKDGNPCISGVCIGDDITQIKGVKWTAQHPAIRERQTIAYNGQIIVSAEKFIAPKPVLQQISAALIARNFDASSIAALNRIQIACDKFDFISSTAHFLSPSGHVTTVFFQPTANNDFKGQTFRVTHIQREFDTAVTDKQKGELSNALSQNYQSVIAADRNDAYRSGKFPSVEISNVLGAGIRLSLKENGISSTKRVDNLLQNLKCGGSKTISVE